MASERERAEQFGWLVIAAGDKAKEMALKLPKVSPRERALVDRMNRKTKPSRN